MLAAGPAAGNRGSPLCAFSYRIGGFRATENPLLLALLGLLMILDTNGIQKILPHRYPFLMVDAIVEMERLKRIVGEERYH